VTPGTGPLAAARDDAGSDVSTALVQAPDLMTFVRRGGRLPATRGDRIRTLIMLGRPRTCVPGLLAFALGFSYTGAAPSARMALGACLALSIGFSANLHNVATDLHEDSRNLPGRVTLLGKVGSRWLVVACRALGVAMMAGAVALGAYFTLFMGLAVVGLHQYSSPPVRSKGRPILGLWVFAQAVVFPFLFGWTTAPGRMLETLLAAMTAPLRSVPPPPAEVAWPSWRYLAMWFFLTLWFMAKGTFKNVPDYDGDLAAGVRTSATECRDRRSAARLAAGLTVAAYLSLVPLVVFGLERPRILFALVWLVPVIANCVRLVRAGDGASSNAVLTTDMRISSGFIATLLLLEAPRPENLAFVVIGAAILFGSDLLELDSRREADVCRGIIPESGVQLRGSRGK
jgi:4-hydroxybenzoate polyprenyltransferase